MSSHLLTEPGQLTPDLRLIQRAVREGWKIPEGLLKALPAAMGQIVLQQNEAKTHFSYKPRERIQAARVLALLHGQNQRDDPAVQRHEHAHFLAIERRKQRLLERLNREGDDRGGADPTGEAPGPAPGIA